MRVVRYDRFAGVDGLFLDEVPAPPALAGHVVFRVMASCINPGSVSALHGSPFTPIRDVAGVVTDVGEGVDGVSVGDEVLGWVQDWSAHAELVAVPATQVIPKPHAVGWDLAGSLFVTPMAGLAAVQAVEPAAGDVLVIAGASGGVGLTAAQLAVRAGASVIGVAGAANAALLRSFGVTPVDYAGDRFGAIREAAAGRQITAFIDAAGRDSLDLALELEVERDRIATVVDATGGRDKGVTFTGTMNAGGVDGLASLAALVEHGGLEIPIAATFPLAEVQAAYRAVGDRSRVGRVVLHPQE